MKKEQIKTAKFGGSSLADAAHFRKVKEIVEADPARGIHGGHPRRADAARRMRR